MTRDQQWPGCSRRQSPLLSFAVLHCIGVLYMFVALNEVCDSFFVPALEVLVDAVNMDMTVAGATFMAAGGSAPELFTSFLGVFVSKNNVGFGTIVGSAVFNVLFVIGVCAIAASGKNADGSRMALELTPYPLFRDSMWYILSLLTLVLFFLDQKIEWWEALLQFFVYVGYVAFMMKNAHFEKVALQRCPCLRPRHPAKRTKWVRHAFGTLAGGGGEQGRRGSALAATAKAQPQTAPGASAPPRSNLASASAIRVAPAPSKDEISDFQPDGAKHAVADGPAPQAPAGDTEALVSKGEAAGSPKPGHSWKQVRQAVTRVEVLSSMIKNDADEPDEPEGIPEDYFTWPSESDTDEDGELLGRAWLRRAMFVVVAPIRLLLIVSTPDPVPKEKVFLCWSRGPCDILCGPESADSSPAKAPAARSKPDAGSGTPARSKSAPTPSSHPAEQPAAPASTKEKRKTSPMFLITFVLSIVWIGVFSYLMVWWATLAGVVFGMPPEVMGLTFLAAGTSVPDLLTSVIVASKGFGDMAVSSSIGSNVFDVTVGLPLPWLLGTIAFGQPIDVASDGLFSSVLVLFLMLILVVISIAVAGWKLSLSLGAAMFLLYGLFVAHSLLTEYGVIPPIA